MTAAERPMGVDGIMALVVRFGNDLQSGKAWYSEDIRAAVSALEARAEEAESMLADAMGEQVVPVSQLAALRARLARAVEALGKIRDVTYFGNGDLSDNLRVQDAHAVARTALEAARREGTETDHG